MPMSSGVAVVQGVTGPGRRVTLAIGNAEEITFRLKKNVIEITNSRGEYGSFDLAQVNSIIVNSDGQSFSIAVQSKDEEDDRSKAASDAGDARPKTTPGTGHAEGTAKTGTGSQK